MHFRHFNRGSKHVNWETDIRVRKSPELGLADRRQIVELHTVLSSTLSLAFNPDHIFRPQQ